VNSQLGAAPPGPASPQRHAFTWGTIHVSGLDTSGDLFSCTSTSGLSYKIAGRVGDSPLVGAGLYTDNAAGSVGCTGRGEATLHNCSAYLVVELMAQGRTPEEACLEALRRIADRTRQPRLLDESGRPAFNVTLYAVRKDGLTGSASMHQGYEHVVHVGGRTETRPCAFLFAKP
jgi:N4-(beta-N-acetylglucosaminyl)-L-asparaginase